MTVAMQVGLTWSDETYDLPLVLPLRPLIELSDDDLLELSSLNGDLRLELSAEGELLIMPPAGSESSSSNAEITMQTRL